MNGQETPKRLTHYTTIPALFNILYRRELCLGDPARWEDRNDAAVMEAYRRKKGVERVFALCFLAEDETLHHWYKYARDNQGCRLDFDVEKLLALVRDSAGFSAGPMRYRTIEEARRGVKDGSITADDYPFIKRNLFRCEEEYRIVWEGKSGEDVKSLPIEYGHITSITISETIPGPVFDSLKAIIFSLIKDAPQIPVHHSSLNRNSHWVNIF